MNIMCYMQSVKSILQFPMNGYKRTTAATSTKSTINLNKIDKKKEFRILFSKQIQKSALFYFYLVWRTNVYVYETLCKKVNRPLKWIITRNTWIICELVPKIVINWKLGFIVNKRRRGLVRHMNFKFVLIHSFIENVSIMIRLDGGKRPFLFYFPYWCYWAIKHQTTNNNLLMFLHFVVVAFSICE